MTNRKISDFTALTAPASTDTLPIIDQSETGTEKNKKITYANLLSKAPDGSASAPSFSFSSDPNTGISGGSDTLTLSTGGSGRLTISSAGLVTIPGDLTVSGTTTTIDTTTLTVKDKNIEIAKGNGNDAAVDGAGITVDSTEGDKTWNWVDSTDAWTSSEHIDLASGKVLKVAGTEVLSATQYTGNAATATTVTNITVADESTDTSCNVLFTTAATGSLPPKTGTNLTFNSSSGALTSTSFVGALTGNVTGNASGSAGSCTGNAATATALATARAINGVDFDGTGAITVTAAAGTLTGTELKSTVVTSSLTSVGTLSSLASGAITTTDNLAVDNAKEVRLYEADSNGSAYVGIKGATDKGSEASYTVSFPAAAPTANQVLKANASTPTDLEWVTDTGGNATSITIADESTDTTCFPLFATAATGDLGLKSGSNLTFNSANGTLGATIFSGSGASLTDLPAGNLTGTVADARISTLTSSKLSGALPAIDGSALTGISAGATGGGSDEVFVETGQTVTTSYTLSANKNAVTVSPSINSGVTITVPSGATLVIL